MYGFGYSLYNRTPFLGSGSGFDPAAQAYFAATGITGATQQAAINNLVKGLKTDGIWSKMKAVYPFVTDNRNLLSYTEDFSNVYWQKQNCTITTDAITAPNGSTTADKMAESTTANTFRQTRALPTISTPTATTYTYSVYLKAAERNWAFLNIEGGTIGVGANFNLTTGTVGITTSGTTATISNAGNGWYRCTVSGNVGTGSIYPVTYIMNGDNVFTYVGVVGNGIYFWGAQLELGSTATTYQPIATTQQAFIASQFKFNLVNPVDSDAAFRLVFNGGWTHSSNGALPNGTNGYADTKLVPLSVFSSANSISFGYYSRTIGGAAETRMSMGAFDGASDSSLIIRWNNGFSYSNLNENLYTALYTNADTHGFYVANRNTINREQGWKNGIKMIDVVNTPTTRTNKNVYLGALNNNTAPLYFDNKQSAFAHIADGLTDTEAANLYTRVQTFNQALGRQVGVPIVSDADAQAFLNSAEITDLTQANAINTLVTDLKTQGLWTKMKAIYPFVGGTASTHKWNLKDPRDLDAAYRLVFNGGWTHSSNGATPNGTNGYADTKLVPSSVLTTSSAHFSKYNRTNDLVNFKLDGSYTISNSTLFQHNYTSANGCIGQATSTATYTATNTQGLFTATRIATNAFKVFKNTSNIASNTTSITAMPNSSVYIGARNEDGVSPGFYNSYQAAFASIGDGLNDTEAAALYTAVQTYQTTLSRQV
jgi:hypothetical protein